MLVTVNRIEVIEILKTYIKLLRNEGIFVEKAFFIWKLLDKYGYKG